MEPVATKQTKIFFIIFIIFVIGSLLATYNKYIVKKDFNIITEQE